MKNNWYSNETKLEVYTALTEVFPMEFIHEFPIEKGIDGNYIMNEMDSKAMTLIIGLLQELGKDIC